jgi:putative heme-binding domain-containing protein
MIRSFAIVLFLLASLSAPARADIGPIPQWIWSSELPLSDELASFEYTFDLPGNATAAELSVLADDEAEVRLDDHAPLKSSRSSEWAKIDLGALKAGAHRLTASAKNVFGFGGVAVRLRIRLADGATRTIVSGPDWKTPTGYAVSHGLVGVQPWGDPAGEAGDYYQWKDALGGKANDSVSSVRVAPGFKVELLREAQPGESSWISLAFEPSGRLLIGREGRDGKHGLLALTLDAAGRIERVDSVEETLLEPRGIVVQGDHLVVNANNALTMTSVRDGDGDGRYEEVKPLRKSPGGVGHGRNNLIVGPDGAVYSIHGNDVRLPDDGLPVQMIVPPMSRDRLDLCRWDRFLFDSQAKLPAGHLIRTTDPTTAWEVVAGGFRNPYGIDFNDDKELFTFDADNEGDLGAPWYRPTRINHVVSAGDYGWRQGTAMRPAWYPDSLPSTLDIGKTSPTDIKFGSRSNFPGRYKAALYLLDWSYGRIYAVHLTPRGASYTAVAESFLEGRPLNVTDLEFGPDGAMYFVTGGRGTQSGLYRVTVDGAVPADIAAVPSFDESAAQLRVLRTSLESFHGKADPRAVDAAWPSLGSEDRWLQYAARIAVESQPIETWRDRAFAETNPRIAAMALLALARTEDPARQPALLRRLIELGFAHPSADLQLIALRAAEISLFRAGAIDEALAADLRAAVEKIYPTRSLAVNQFACELLVYLKSPSVVNHTIPLLKASRRSEEVIAWLFLLRNVKDGWSLANRKIYLDFLDLADSFPGGRELPVALYGIGSEFHATLTPSERLALKAHLEPSGVPAAAQLPTAARPLVENWTTDSLLKATASLPPGDAQRGQILYRNALCIRCHRFGREGRPIGPDLHSVTRRLGRKDLLDAIVTPSKVIDDKYRDTTFVLTTGKSISGRIVGGDDATLLVAPNPTAPFETTSIMMSEIETRQASPVSPMPMGLLNTFTAAEALDLFAYLESDGRP